MPEALRFIKFTEYETVIAKIQTDHQSLKDTEDNWRGKDEGDLVFRGDGFSCYGNVFVLFLKVITNE